MFASKSEQECCVLLYYWFWQASIQAQHSPPFSLFPINGYKMVQSRDSTSLENIYKGKAKQHDRDLLTTKLAGSECSRIYDFYSIFLESFSYN